MDTIKILDGAIVTKCMGCDNFGYGTKTCYADREKHIKMEYQDNWDTIHKDCPLKDVEVIDNIDVIYKMTDCLDYIIPYKVDHIIIVKKGGVE